MRSENKIVLNLFTCTTEFSPDHVPQMKSNLMANFESKNLSDAPAVPQKIILQYIYMYKEN